MKRLIVILFILLSVVGYSQSVPPGYTGINSRYQWLGGEFKALTIPAYATTPSLRTGQTTHAGAIGLDSVLHIPYYYSGGTWRPFGTTVNATSPITASGTSTVTISTSMNTNRLIGRYSASTGVMEEIKIGNYLSLSNDTLHSTFSEVDGDSTNEYQTLVTDNYLGSYRVTLSDNGGSIRFIPDYGITITQGGSAGNSTATLKADSATLFPNLISTIALTTTGTSGASTWNTTTRTLNIPQYQAAGTYVTSVSATYPAASSGGTTPNISIDTASGKWRSENYYNTIYTPLTRSISTGYGLSGGGNFTANRTFILDSATVFPNLISTIALTTNGTSGAATWNTTTRTLNIPQYTFTETTFGTVTSVSAGNGMNFSTITSTGSVVLGTPSSTTLSSTNAVTTNSHTHAFVPGGTSSQVILGDATLGTYYTGTVTSVGLSLPAEFSVTNSPVTSSGTLTGSWANQSAFTVFRRASGTGVPSFGTIDTTYIASFSDKVRSLFSAGTGLSYVNGVYTNTGDLSNTNEAQTLSHSSNSTTHTVTLDQANSAGGGSLVLAEGTNITLTTSGSGANQTVTIASTASGSDFTVRNGLNEFATDIGELGGLLIRNTQVSGQENTYDMDWAAIDSFSVSAVNAVLNAGATGAVKFGGKIQFTTDISPTTISANENDYSPTDITTASVLRLSSDQSRNITGLTGGVDGRIIKILNVGSNNIVLKDEDANSTAANRFDLPNDITLSAGDGFEIIYDATSSRWRTTQNIQVFTSENITGDFRLNMPDGASSIRFNQGSGITYTQGGSSGNPILTITATDPSTTNELQTITNSSDATSHTVTLSNSGGTVQLIEGTGISLTTGGTSGAGTVTIAASGGSPGGSSTQLQYNNGGSFGGISGATSNGSNVTFGTGNLRVNDLRDPNGGIWISQAYAGTAVNYLTVSNAGSGSSPSISATGQTNVDINFATNGTGTFNLQGNSTQAATLRLYEDTDGGTNYVSFKSPVLGGNYDYILPTGYPAASTYYYLTSTTGGTMSWAQLPTFSSTSDATSLTWALASGGSLKLIAGDGVSFTVGGTSADPQLTINVHSH
jgi:hypothetical protein